jgi:hypothetical protein
MDQCCGSGVLSRILIFSIPDPTATKEERKRILLSYFVIAINKIENYFIFE